MFSSRLVIVAAALAVAPVAGSAQVGLPDQTFRIFLYQGEPLPSYGDYAVVGDRVVFALPIGTAETEHQLQLMSLPVSSVDLDRTASYAFSLKAARYAASRGESEYLAMTEEVAAALEAVRGTEDPVERLELAERARARLLAWSGSSYAYRAEDIRQLTGLFDQVIGELRAAAGQAEFTLDLSSGPATPDLEPLLPVPTFRESIGLALMAARVADLTEERMAILRTAESVAGGAAGSETLRGEVTREIEAEVAAGPAYEALEADLIARAEAALDVGDIAAVERLRDELAVRDMGLGARRPGVVAALRERLVELLGATIAYRIELNRYAVGRAGRLAYEREIRPVLSGLDGLGPILEALRDRTGTAFWRLERSITRLEDMRAQFDDVRPPDDLSDLHATLASALMMAREACARWRRFVITTTDTTAAEASTAAAASMMLTLQMREELVTRLYPPKAR